MGATVTVVGHVLIQLALRFTLGMALAMVVTPPQWVVAGFFRVHLWVLLGINTLAAAALWTSAQAYSHRPVWWVVFVTATALAAGSYAGSVVWLYQKVRAGRVLLIAIAVMALAGGLVALSESNRWQTGEPDTLGMMRAVWSPVMLALDFLSSAGLLGFVVTSMLLGHYYLNWPGMKLAALERLINGLFLALLFRAGVAGLGLFAHLATVGSLPAKATTLLACRWLTGILGPAVTGWMARQALRVPNTQSATGILYAGTVLTLLGELLGQLLGTLHPMFF